MKTEASQRSEAQAQHPSSPLDLVGRTALVCGASRGIGRAAAHALASRGASCVVLARNHTQLADLLETLPTAGHAERHRMVCTDMKDTAGLAEVLGELRNETATGIDIIVNNTGGPPAGPLSEASCEALSEAFRWHLLATQVLVTTMTPGMKERRFGRIINVLSTSVRIPIPGLGVSNTIRAAMAAHAKTLSNELGPYGITVNNVLPGYTKTERFETLATETASRTGKSKAAIEEQWLSSVPLRRFAEPEEVAAAIAFFASPAAGYITGQNLAVDGGRTGSI